MWTGKWLRCATLWLNNNHVQIETILIFILGLLTSAIGASVGGGGLILTPALILLGIETKTVIGTTTIAYIITSAVGLYKFHRHKKVDFRLSIYASLLLAIGSIIGASFLLKIPNNLATKLIGFFLMAILIMSLIKSDTGLKARAVSKTQKRAGYLFLFLTGIYKGLINSGTGILGTYTYIYCFGKTYLESSANRKLPGWSATSHPPLFL